MVGWRRVSCRAPGLVYSRKLRVRRPPANRLRQRKVALRLCWRVCLAGASARTRAGCGECNDAAAYVCSGRRRLVSLQLLRAMMIPSLRLGRRRRPQARLQSSAGWDDSSKLCPLRPVRSAYCLTSSAYSQASSAHCPGCSAGPVSSA